MSALLLSAIGGAGWQTCVTFSAHSLVAIERFGQQRQGWVVHTPAQTQHQVQRRFLLDVVITQGSPIFELLPGKDQSLLIRWDAFLVLNLGLHIVNRIGRFHIQRYGLPRQGFDKDLHGISCFCALFSFLPCRLQSRVGRQAVLDVEGAFPKT